MVKSFDYFFTQMWSLFQNILLQRYTFLWLLEFFMKTLNRHMYVTVHVYITQVVRNDILKTQSCDLHVH